MATSSPLVWCEKWGGVQKGLLVLIVGFLQVWFSMGSTGSRAPGISPFGCLRHHLSGPFLFGDV